MNFSGDREYLHRQLIKLGDMMGDGLHHEDPSISSEYRAVAKALYPEMYPKKKRKPSQKFINTLTLCSCGSKSLKMKTSIDGILIYCPNCKANENGALQKSKESARDNWNHLFKSTVGQ